MPLATGALYGLTLRLMFTWELLDGVLEIVSTAFLVVAPLCVGALAVFMMGGEQRITVGQALRVSAHAMMWFLLAMLVLFLEGIICLVLVAPVYFVAAMIGGAVARWFIHRGMASRGTLSAFAILPLLAGPFEAAQDPVQSEQVIVDSIRIAAPPEIVFDQLAQVRDIRPDELGFSFLHLIGLPRPVAADMHGEGSGAVRISRWEKNVRFEEVITTWNRPYAMHYRFHIPPGSIPRDALDRHVEMGGEYFTVIDGGYDLARTSDGGTLLTLRTRFANRSQLKLYGNLWGKMVLHDFHGSILGLIRSRAEAASKGA
ncbi:hypothetical protein [Pseudoduganella albidiflava]|uniref:SRPBCC family protein n=1 Tax=Pseudoduganella albidiflava TaxID=321983 RepID=A0A411X6Z6_9BURK|nr:hypothetical protein [Pseudoduganella albidiflava]QBI04623.1 hypothetical protein EYF70_30210 [Pseudoduganella albidiflava]GGY28720.1 hypothetical protein GCM10007387_08650 [Pseudoduganella albidiflava]